MTEEIRNVNLRMTRTKFDILAQVAAIVGEHPMDYVRRAVSMRMERDREEWSLPKPRHEDRQGG